MKKCITLLLVLSLNFSFSQDMTNGKLNDIFTSVSDTITGNNGRWQFNIKNITLICLTDSTNNRMRIISPIIEAYKLTDELKTNALFANFHTALDVKYAISEDILWSAFIHPLDELTEKQVVDAIKQVYSANATFGSTYSSTSLVFPSRKSEVSENIKEEEDLILKQKI